jgi:hypothetical protein
VMITVLINKHMFGFEDVLIIPELANATTSYLLLVIHKHRVVVKSAYSTIRGARIAFFRQFGEIPINDIRPEWSHFYPPEAKWIKKKLEKANDQGSCYF